MMGGAEGMARDGVGGDDDGWGGGDGERCW